MITPYYGEFLIIPMPLELSLERCSNACHYCFSNLNGYTLKSSYKSILNQIKGFAVGKSHAAQLLRDGYPICFSNRSDPFCRSNSEFSIKLCEIFTELGIDIAFQTKGGKGIDEILSFMPSSCWYITISQDDENLRKKIEPGAPPISERLELIDKLVSKGHHVTVGINPYIPEWIDNKRKLVEQVKQAGAYGILVEGFHLSREQKRRINQHVIDEKIINRALKGHADDFEMGHYHELCEIITSNGLELWSFWNNHSSGFWDRYYQRYKCFPIITNFINHCIENLEDGDIVDFDQFKSIMGGMPKNSFKIDSYVISINRSFRNKGIPTKGSATDLLQIFWSSPQLKTCPANHPMLSIVAEKVPGSKTLVIEGKLPVYMFNSNGFKSIFVDKNGKEIS